jgi:hypothetical protein
MTFDLATTDPTKRWKFEDYDSGDTWAVSGKAIREKGFGIWNRDAPSFRTVPLSRMCRTPRFLRKSRSTSHLSPL